MREMWKRHRLAGWILCAAVGLAALAAYLYALFLPGVWYRDVFLYQQKDGSFQGEDTYAVYRMEMETEPGAAEVVFSVNDVTHTYRLTHDRDSRKTQIFEDNELKFSGEVWLTDGIGLYMDENGEIVNTVEMVVRTYPPKVEELFPGYTTLLYWGVEGERDTRGKPIGLVFALLLGVILFVDIRFPDLHFHFRHGMAVDGGKPSDMYRAGQKLGRVLLVIGMLFCAGAGFAIH